MDAKWQEKLTGGGWSNLCFQHDEDRDLYELGLRVLDALQDENR